MKKAAFLIIICLAIGCKTEKIKKEIYLIPDHYIGNIVLIYNQSTGLQDSIVSGEVIYKVPKDGFLYLKGSEHLQDFRNMEYYYYSEKRKSRICDYSQKDIVKDCSAIILRNYIGSYQRNLKSPIYQYAVITVGAKDTTPPNFDPRSYQFR